MTAPDALRLEGVTAGYGDSTVLRELDLTLAAGTAGALLGANGAGKTTTLNLASGLLRPFEGRVLIHGEDVTERRSDQRQARGLCHVPEGRGVFPSLTVRENLILQAAKGDEAAAVERAVAAFPSLGRRIGMAAGTLSGGERQMLAVARAFVSSPTVVLLDEVSLGLAPVIVDEIYAFLVELRATGAAILIVEQFVDRALDFADEVWVLARGAIGLHGRAADIDREQVAALYLGTDLHA